PLGVGTGLGLDRPRSSGRDFWWPVQEHNAPIENLTDHEGRGVRGEDEKLTTGRARGGGITKTGIQLIRAHTEPSQALGHGTGALSDPAKLAVVVDPSKGRAERRQEGPD